MNSFNAFQPLLLRPRVAMAILLAVWSGGAPSSRWIIAPVGNAVSAERPTTVFHLGTAAGPFGWSSAVADFDDDGRPDFTVADRIGQPAGGGYRYRIVFSMSGGESRTISFESPSAALTVTVADVDHDHDLDVLVADAPSSIVGTVWLNDGHGRFVASRETSASDRRLAREIFDSTQADCPLASILPPRASILHAGGLQRASLRSIGRIPADTDPAGAPSPLGAAPSRGPPPSGQQSFI